MHRRTSPQQNSEQAPNSAWYSQVRLAIMLRIAISAGQVAVQMRFFTSEQQGLEWNWQMAVSLSAYFMPCFTTCFTTCIMCPQHALP